MEKIMKIHRNVNNKTIAKNLKSIFKKNVIPLQEIIVFFIKNFNKKKPPYGFFAPMSNLTKMPFWTSQFGPDYFD